MRSKPVRILTITSVFLAVPLLTGCLQHLLEIDATDPEAVKLFYRVSGDPMDLEDDRQLIPDSTVWTLSDEIKDTDSETERTIEGSPTPFIYSKLSEMLDWRRTEDDTLHLSRKVNMQQQDLFLATRWKFTGSVESRRFIELYGDEEDFVPPECKVLDDEKAKEMLSAEEIETLEEKFALGVLQWNRERYLKLLKRCWERAKQHLPNVPDTSDTVFSISRSGWDEDLHQYMNQLEIVDVTVVNLDWWDDLRSLFLGHLVDLTGTDSLEFIIRSADAMEREYQITKDINDDTFHYRLRMPGFIVSTDGERDDEGWINWEFEGKTLQNESVLMSGVTLEPVYWRVAVALILVLGGLSLLLGRVFGKKSGEAPSSGEL